MRLKSFYARTMTEAMQMVRDNLGEDAVIVATREENGGKSVRVTAALEHDDHFEEVFEGAKAHVRAMNQAPASVDWVAENSEDDESVVVEQLTDVMLRHSVPGDITDQVISCATVLGMTDVGTALTAALEHLYSFRPLPQKPTRQAIMLVGPPGAGKTLAVAKLAARDVMTGQKVAVITTDTVRAGGAEQLGSLTRLMHVELQRAATPTELQAQIVATRGADHVYIDTGGMNPFEPEEMRSLARLLSTGEIDPVLVLPAGGDADESGEIARVYATLGVRSLLPTRLDIARRFGGLLAAAHHGGLIFADASHNAKVADGLIPLSPPRLARLLMPQAFRQAQASKTPPQTRQTVKTG